MATAHTLTLPAESADWALPSRRKIGVISLIVTETALFTIFAVAYLFYIGKSLTGPYPCAGAGAADPGNDLSTLK